MVYFFFFFAFFRATPKAYATGVTLKKKDKRKKQANKQRAIKAYLEGPVQRAQWRQTAGPGGQRPIWGQCWGQQHS